MTFANTRQNKPSKIGLFKRPPKDVEHDPLTVTVTYYARNVLSRTAVDFMIAAAAKQWQGRSMGAGIVIATWTRDMEYAFPTAKVANIFCAFIKAYISLPKMKVRVG